MPPDVALAGHTDGDSSTVFGVEITDGMVHGITAPLTQSNDNLVLEYCFSVQGLSAPP